LHQDWHCFLRDARLSPMNDERFTTDLKAVGGEAACLVHNRRMKRKAVIICRPIPHMMSVGGYERMILDCQSHMFSDYDVYLLTWDGRSRLELLHDGQRVPEERITAELDFEDLAFALFFCPDSHPSDPAILKGIVAHVPSFCFVQRHPEEGVDERRFRGVITFSSECAYSDMLVVGGWYDPEIFYKKRKSEEYVVCVGRIYPEKNQLELVQDYREKIYSRYKLPLYLVGGTEDMEYLRQVYSWVDQESVLCTADPADPTARHSWRSAEEIAALCNRARLFVAPSPRESFGIALVEAMACGATCAVNGAFAGFDPDDLRPHVYGNIMEKNGGILEIVEQALEQEVRIDASMWVKKFSLPSIRSKIMAFIESRL
jgi:glycosyltransferase involved in cell wall biosynthesis